MKLYMVSELSISCLLFTLISPPPPDGQCAGGTHPTGMHSCLLRFHSQNKISQAIAKKQVPKHTHTFLV